MNELVQENRYTKNGENFRVCILVEENGEWKIDQMSAAPVPLFIQKNINLQSDSEVSIKKQLSEI